MVEIAPSPSRYRFDSLDLDRLESQSRFFSINRANLFSFHERDHADGGEASTDKLGG